MPSSVASSTKSSRRHGRNNISKVAKRTEEAPLDLAEQMQNLTLHHIKLNDEAIKREIKKEDESDTSSSAATAALMSPTISSGSTRSFSVASTATPTVNGSQVVHRTGGAAAQHSGHSRGSQSSGATRALSTCSEDTASQILEDFFADTASYVSSMSSTTGKQAAKLALWQAILVTLGLCKSEQGQIIMPGLVRPSHFPRKKLDLPDSLTACKNLIRQYVFVNIVNFEKSQLGMEKLILFTSTKQVIKYTEKHHRFAKLARTKEAFLQPLLRNIVYRRNYHGGTLARIAEESEEEDYDSDEYESDSDDDTYDASYYAPRRVRAI